MGQVYLAPAVPVEPVSADFSGNETLASFSVFRPQTADWPVGPVLRLIHGSGIRWVCTAHPEQCIDIESDYSDLVNIVLKELRI